MLKSEFCMLIETDPENFSERDFEKINAVYMEHPAIKDVEGKAQIANIFVLGGMEVINDMYRRVLLFRSLSSRILNADKKIEEFYQRRGKAVEAVYADFQPEFEKIYAEKMSTETDLEELKGGK